MSDLAGALREAGYPEVASELKRRELAGRLRESGRPDLADALISGEQTPAPGEPEPTSSVRACRSRRSWRPSASAACRTWPPLVVWASALNLAVDELFPEGEHDG